MNKRNSWNRAKRETFKEIGTAFKATPDKWVGAKLGIYCSGLSGTKTGGYADFDWFRISKNEENN